MPEGLTVFSLPEHHRRRLRTSNPIERSVQQELKRRASKVRVFPNADSLTRLVSAVLVEIDDKLGSRHQMGMPECLITAPLNFHISGCAIG